MLCCAALRGDEAITDPQVAPELQVVPADQRVPRIRTRRDRAAMNRSDRMRSAGPCTSVRPSTSPVAQRRLRMAVKNALTLISATGAADAGRRRS